MLASAAGVKPFEVGFAGLKDRNAVTTQHFTVPRGKRAAEDLIGFKGEGYEILSSIAHQRKLPRGALEGNRFVIVVRGLACDAAQLRQRVQRIGTGGSPNYFGEQRCAALDVHPTAPLAGQGESLARGEVLALEDAIAGQFPEALAVIHAEGMKPERRALRIRVRDLEHEYSGDTLQLRFALSAGSFATTVLREIIAGASTGE